MGCSSEPTAAQRASIERAAKKVLEARDDVHESTYADMYDQNAMPDELRRAHFALDRAVKRIYGLANTATDVDCVNFLLAEYQKTMDRLDTAEAR